MRERKQFSRLLPAVLMCITLLLSACHLTTNNKTEEKGAKNLTKLDSLMYAIYDERYTYPQHALLMTDSLQETGDLTSNMADECRAEIYDALGQSRTASFYAQKSLKDGLLFEEDAPSFYAAYRLLAHININNMNWKKALDYATKGLNHAKKDNSRLAQDYIPKFLSQIGSCQIMLGRKQEGNANFQRVYETVEQETKKRNRFDLHYNLFAIVSNCIECHLMEENIAEAESWLPRMEEAYEKALAAPDIKEDFSAYAKQCMEINKALVLAKAGHTAEAAKHYRCYLASTSEQDNDFLGAQISYLKTTGQWAELAELSEQISTFHQGQEKTPSMDYLRLELAPLFQAQLKSKHTGKALATAERITNLLDSAYIRTRNDDAAELAVIYEIQEKEATIAKQQADIIAKNASITRIEMMTVAGILLLLVVFLIVFSFHRQQAAGRLKAAHAELQEAYKELEQKNEQLTTANALAQESSRMKTDFIHQISHEIRTPLNVLSGFTQIVTSPGMELDDATKQDINNKITENTDRITSLVNKMLELSEASSLTVIERNDEVPAVQVASQAVEESGITHLPHLKFDIQVSEDVENTMIKTHLKQATRALVLLLDNAQKFTIQNEKSQDQEDTKKPSVLLKIVRTDGFVQFIVEDTGIGVPAEEAEHIFGEFVQLDEYYEGTGIGLTIARSIARRLGGDIILDTSYTGGARFVYTIRVC